MGVSGAKTRSRPATTPSPHATRNTEANPGRRAGRGDSDHGRRRPIDDGVSAPSRRRALGRVHPYFPDALRLLLYDLERDPFAARAVNDEHPELVRRYHRLLLDHWRAHQALVGRFTEAGEAALDPNQLQQLRALGYIQ